MTRRIAKWLLLAFVVIWLAKLSGFGMELALIAGSAAAAFGLARYIAHRGRESQRRLYGSALTKAVSLFTGPDRSWADLMESLGLTRDLDQRRSPQVRIGGYLAGSQLGASAVRPVRYIPSRVSIAKRPYGLEALVRGVPGHSLALWQSRCGQLASALGVPEVTVTEPSPNTFALALRTVDPLANPIVLPGVMASESGYDIPLGLDETGAGVYLPINNTSGCVIGGLPGSGKSAFLTHVLASWASRPDIQMAIVDGKSGYDLAALAPRAYRFLTATESANLEMVRACLRDVQLLMEQRIRHSLELWGHHSLWMAGPSPTHPVVVVVVDECQVYLDNRALVSKEEKTLGLEIDSIVRDLVKRGRSAGILVCLTTQRPTADAIPTGIRDNAGLRICFGVRTRESAVAVLGDWSSDDPVSPIGLSPGVGVTFVNHQLVRFRAPYVPDDAVRCHVSLHAALTADPLDLLTQSLLSLSQ